MSKSALDAQRLNAFLIEPEKLVIVTDEKHPLYDERIKLPIDENLVLSIMAHGVKLPVIGRKNGDAIEVVDGRQRVRAAVEANKRLLKRADEQVRVKLHLERGSDADVFGVTVLANEFRHGDDMLTKAKKASRLIAMGKSDAEVVTLYGITTQTLSAWLRLLEAAPSVQKAVASGEVSASAAAALAKLPREEQETKLVELRAAAPTEGKRAGKVSARAAKKSASKSEKPARPTPGDVKAAFEYAQRENWDDEIIKILGWVLGETGAIAALGRKIETIHEANRDAASEAKEAKAAKGAG